MFKKIDFFNEMQSVLLLPFGLYLSLSVLASICTLICVRRQKLTPTHTATCIIYVLNAIFFCCHFCVSELLCACDLLDFIIIIDVVICEFLCVRCIIIVHIYWNILNLFRVISIFVTRHQSAM